MKRIAYKQSWPSLLDLIETREMILEADQDAELEQRERWQASQAAQPSYREQYQ